MHDKERLYAARSRFLRWGAGALLAAVVLAAVLIGSGLLFRGHLPSDLPSAAAPSQAPNRVHSALSAAIKPPVTVSGPSIGKTGDDTSTIEVCGKGKVTLGASDPLAAYRYIDALSKPAARHWLTALLDSDDYHARAAGLFLEGKITDGFAVKPMAEQTRDALVQLAVGTHDPTVYAIAVRACNAYLDPVMGACEQISLREWARIDADNATPWLLLAGAARAKNNPAAEADAFNQAAKARRIDSYYDSLLVKVTARGRRFIDAARRMERSLREFRVRGVKVNVPFLIQLMTHPQFLAGTCTTTFIDNSPELFRLEKRRDRATRGKSMDRCFK